MDSCNVSRSNVDAATVAGGDPVFAMKVIDKVTTGLNAQLYLGANFSHR
jgi:hypothetical protein